MLAYPHSGFLAMDLKALRGDPHRTKPDCWT